MKMRIQMTKYVVLGDLHLNSKNGSEIYTKHQQKFFDKVLFPFLKEHQMNVIQLGDLFDQRKYANFVGLDAAFKGFFDEMPNRIYMTTLLGNHDVVYRESLKVNAPELLCSDYSYLTIVNSPQTIDGIDYIPWICNDNREEINEFIQNSKSKICCGHFEVAGFAMQRGVPSHGGLDVKTFEKYQLVLSGHYHTRSSSSNITYVGTPYELTWADYKDPKGFHVLDTETMELEFIENPYNLFETIYYDDTNPTDICKSDYVEKYVKVVVVNKTDYNLFDRFINNLNNSGAYDVKIIENFTDNTVGSIDEEIILQDTLSVLDSYIDSLNHENPEELKNQIKALYVQAQELIE